MQLLRPLTHKRVKAAKRRFTDLGTSTAILLTKRQLVKGRIWSRRAHWIHREARSAAKAWCRTMSGTRSYRSQVKSRWTATSNHSIVSARPGANIARTLIDVKHQF
jgi:hypothetical protein